MALTAKERAEQIADFIADSKYLDKHDLSIILEIHLHDFHLDSLKTGSASTYDSIIQEITNSIYQLGLERASIKRQLTQASDKVANKEKVDFRWIASAKYAYTMKGLQSEELKLKLGHYNGLKKHERVLSHVEKDNKDFKLLRFFVKKMIGEEEYLNLWKKIHALPEEDKEKIYQSMTNANLRDL